MHISIKDLNLIISIANSSSLTQAAKKVFISPSAACVRIKSLEEKLGVRLLDRDSKGVELTSSGELVLSHALVISRQMENLCDEVLRGSGFLKIRIYVDPIYFTDKLFHLIADFLAEHPNSNVDLKEKARSEILEGVADDPYTIGVIFGNFCSHECHVLDYKRDRLVIVASKNHPLSNKDSVNFSEALNFQQVGLIEKSELTKFLRVEARKKGCHLDYRFQTNDLHTIIKMVDLDTGIAIMPLSDFERLNHSKNVRSIVLMDEWKDVGCSVLTHEAGGLPNSVLELANKIIAHTSQASFPLLKGI